MSLPTGSQVLKDPNASAWPKGIDWTDYLAALADDETLASSDWIITGPDSSLTIDDASASIVAGNKKTQMKLSGGRLGYTYTVTNTIVTSSGVTDERSFFVRIQQR